MGRWDKAIVIRTFGESGEGYVEILCILHMSEIISKYKVKKLKRDRKREEEREAKK